MKKPLANLQFAYTLSFLALLFSTILPQENPEAENPVLKDQKPVLWAQIQADSGAWYAALAPANDPENPDSPTPDRETGDSPEIPLGDLGIGSGISLSGIEISGFGDFLFATTPEATHGGYQLGQVEVDLDAAVNERVGLSVAIAYDAEGESFGLGAFTVDFRLGDNTGEGLFSAAWLESAGIVAGMFDVPFGLDWQVYPSIDRKLISAPLVVGSTHDGWNDYGVQGYLQTSRLNAVVFGTNGYDGEFALPSEEIYTRETTAALGGRLGIMPWSGLEIGGSYARFLSEDSRDNLHLAGLDFQLHFKSFTAKGEYIRQRENWRTFDPVRVGGFYLQGMYEWGQFGLISRVERSDDPENEGEKLERFGLGGVWRVVENAEIRLEQQFTHNSDATLLQLVVGF